MIINNISVPHNSCRTTQIVQTKDCPLITIGRGSYIVSASIQSGLPTNLHIGQFCSLATDITFMLQIDKDYNRVTTSSDKLVAPLPNVLLEDVHRIKGQILIQNDVWIGHNVTIMSGVKIGNGAIISANAHVVKDVPPYAIVGGNPARVIKYRFTEEQIEDLQNIAWWDWSDEEIIERKPDFSLPIQDFIDKYKTERKPLIKEADDINNKRMLFFPDFGTLQPFWKRVIREYCEKCQSGNILGQLYLYIPENEETDRNLDELEKFLNENCDGSGDIYVQVGQIQDVEELFANADCLISSRHNDMIRYSCLADKYGVKIISAADLPTVF